MDLHLYLLRANNCLVLCQHISGNLLDGISLEPLGLDLLSSSHKLLWLPFRLQRKATHQVGRDPELLGYIFVQFIWLLGSLNDPLDLFGRQILAMTLLELRAARPVFPGKLLQLLF